MSWSPDLFIGEFRPWPDSVHVVRGRTDETLRYVPEDFSAISRENIELRELVRDALTTISWCTIDCYPSDNKKRELNDRARELGVEV